MLTDMDFISYNKRGLIPGPKETLEEFEKRAAFCLSLKQDVLAKIAPTDAQYGEADDALSLSSHLYGIEPDWVPIFFSNWKLQFWHGGAAWIFQLEKDFPLGAVLQLRKNFYKHSSFLGLYKKDELIAHEMAHVGRMAFDEKKYEELLAYRSSQSGFSRYFGPIIQSAFESRLIVYILFTLLMMDLFFLASGSISAYLETQVFKFLPLVLILYGLFRLYKKQKTLNKAEAKLQGIFKSEAPFVLYRLTDTEIDLFSKNTQDEILSYIKNESTLRWKVIQESYFKD